MFLYMIDILGLRYIGFDSHPQHKHHRFKEHVRVHHDTNIKTKLYTAMRISSPSDWKYSVLASGFKSIKDLALAEIEYIKKYDTFYNGLNSTKGGDGIGKHDLYLMTDEEISEIRKALSERMSTLNISKWNSTSLEERKQLTSHLHNDEVYKKKSSSLKQFYKERPSEGKARYESGIAIWRLENRDHLCSQNRINGMIGASKVSKALTVMTLHGEIISFTSNNQFYKQTGISTPTLEKYSNQGIFYKGYLKWES